MNVEIDNIPYNSGEIINRSTIRSAIEPGAANLQVDPIEPIPKPTTVPTEAPTNGMLLDDFMSLADFATPISASSPTKSIPDSTKSKLWQDVEQGIIHGENHEDSQQRHFHSDQPKVIRKKHRYPTRSKSRRSANTVETTTEDDGEPTKFIYLRDKGEKTIPVWKQYEFILRDELGEPRLDADGNPIVVIGMPPEDLVQRVFLTKPDERGNMKRARII